VNLFQKIKTLVLEDRYLIGQHASERLDERGIIEWQVVIGILEGQLLRERLDADPNPAIEVTQMLEDGTKVKAVWSFLRVSGFAKFVTVHYFDEE
jgi:hypothetical protein